MSKASYRLAFVTAFVGILLFIPIGNFRVLFYNEVLITHTILGLILGVMLIRLFYTHLPEELSNPFKPGVKKWNGFKLFLYLIVVILTGIIVLVFHVSWVIYFHGFLGLWALLVGWKHKR